MIQCPYDEKTFSQYSGLSAHLRLEHPDHWKDSIETSLPEGRDKASLGTPERSVQAGRRFPSLAALAKGVPAKVGKGERKPPIPSACPWCSYHTDHPPGLAHHIKKQHPKKWRGNLGATLGRVGKGPGKFAGDLRSRSGKRKRLTRAQKLARQRVKHWYDSMPLEQRRAKWRKYSQKIRDKKRGVGPRIAGETPEKRERRLATMARYRAKLRGSNVNGAVVQVQEAGPALGTLDFCPHCGHNLQVYAIALGMMEQGRVRAQQHETSL